MQTGSIDYGKGLVNINPDTGIRYGAISRNSLDSDANNEIFTEGGVYIPGCPSCGTQFDKDTDTDAIEGCIRCGYKAEDSSEWYGDEPSYIRYEEDTPQGKIIIEGCLDNDYVVTESPFYTLARLCSPCVPGAGDLDTPDEEYGYKTYCLPADFFADNKAPYKINRVTR